MNNFFRAKKRFGQFNIQIHYQVISFFAQIWVLPDMHLDIKIARHPAFESLTLTIETNHLTIIDTRWHADRDFFLLHKLGINNDLSLRAKHRFLERKLNIHGNITPAPDAATTKKTRKNISQFSCIQTGISQTPKTKS